MSESDRILYLGVTVDTFESFFQEKFSQEAVKVYQVKLLIYSNSTTCEVQISGF
ncbi:element excision factor XisH family protein [Moorena sp. SIO3B2]|uniref:element excision factor XisH family protein n=1 Tax=Moorena sp. SIO3B2 TaxID=2607827 RepID=UPI0013CD9108|nr:element excision factor XisH family protein [Moorena sp. SIO3B2]NEP34560.1 hypothetical protein [Moorena sp. SIO3B2]